MYKLAHIFAATIGLAVSVSQDVAPRSSISADLADFCNGADTEDDTICIQEWLNAAEANGANLHAPSGTYFYSSAVIVHSNTQLQCADPQSTVFKFNRTQNSYSKYFLTGKDIENITIKNCGFDVAGNLSEFLSVIAVGGEENSLDQPPVNRNINVQKNHIFDSMFQQENCSPQAECTAQRQYILLLSCENCRVENNDLAGGGRIKLGRPGAKLFVINNRINYVNDNGITVVSIGSQGASKIRIVNNQIINPLSVGIFFGADGEVEENPNLSVSDVIISDNQIEGDWRGSCIRGTLPAKAEQIRIVSNTCTKTGTANDQSTFGINLRKLRSDLSASNDILIGMNKIRAQLRNEHSENPITSSPLGENGAGILIGESHDQLKIIGNSIRDVGDTAILLKATLRDAVIAENNLLGGRLRVVAEGSNFHGTIRDNQITGSQAGFSELLLNASTENSITAGIQGNVITNHDGACVRLRGNGIFQLRLTSNQFLECSEAIQLERGASLAPGSIR